MTQDKTYNVQAVWDNEARVWVASSDDVPGLITEAETVEALLEKLRTLVPELLEVNGVLCRVENADIPVQLHSERTEMIRCRLP